MLQLQESNLLSIRAGKKVKRQPVRDISVENRFYEAHSKVSEIKAPGRRHRDMGSSCIVALFTSLCSLLALLSAYGTLKFYSSSRGTNRLLCLLFSTDSISFRGCFPHLYLSSKKNENHKISKLYIHKLLMWKFCDIYWKKRIFVKRKKNRWERSKQVLYATESRENNK